MSINGSYPGGHPAQSAPGYHQPNSYQHPPYDPSVHFAQMSLASQNGYYPQQQAGPSVPRPLPDVQPIPAPQPKVAYNPPAFRTFQDRKRAKEMALRAQSGAQSPAPTPAVYSTPPPQAVAPVTYTPPTFQPPSQAPPSAVYSSRPAPQIPASPSPVQNGPPPTQYPYQVAQPPPSPYRPVVDVPHSPRSPLPTPRPGSTRPLPQPARGPSTPGTPTTPQTPPALPAAPVVSTVPAVSAVPVVPAIPTAQVVPAPAPISSAIFKENDPNLERSDTISSVRSLDRAGFGSRRPLPKAPVGINSSRSLDRGMPPAASSPGRRAWRRPPSVVEEDGESNMSASPVTSTTPSMASPVQPPTIVVNSAPSVPAIVEPAPAPPSISVAPPPPTIVVPDIIVGEAPAPSPRSVSRPPSVAPPAIVVPDITIGDSAPSRSSPTPVPKIAVPDITVGDAPRLSAAPPVPTIVLPDGTANSSPAPPAITVPDITIGDSTPAPIPGINVPDDGPGDDLSSGEGIAFTGVPVISVSSEESHPTTHNMAHNFANGAIVCAGCQNAIIGRIVNAMGKRFHPQCFKCNECSELLEHVSSYEYEGKAYCHLDYHDKFAPQCHHCRTPIVESRFVTLSDPVLGERYYHELHFFCSECGDPFLDPSKSSAPGARPSLQDEDGETNPFVIHKGHPYCERCHLRLHKPKCKKCAKPIPDIALTAMGAKWHQECFVCTQCGQGFANNLFFPKDGQALCTSCYESSL